ncbi:FAS1 domain-containing protein [Chloropicon primus]|uniref:FAS1 domain-containing protein n=1 Tax=Chloropicon primus TaxID=1764295 RepID=A0A5B8MPQ0_9CHLO|nr:hypothetical protein A3770_06p40930 [Chloropicon primus]UPR00786.1 FAS1 domain-containing protein [Chloropicon primus]|mmetsp:Transcript_2619/g.7210  ORF Transcript_2619/g.7210 Transcript_2619/m.7210 type:complete len:382 (+) Transcript_2619:246-1391(+)|eukprot:QDZ21575.1 hypothetical protein A3770_06p40930 [Chloropicon primus]
MVASSSSSSWLVKVVLVLLSSSALVASVAWAQGAGACFDTLGRQIDSRNDLRYFSSALREAELDASLDGPGPYLVLAPSDKAFESLRSDESGDLLNMELSKLVAFHLAGAKGYEDFLRSRAGQSFGLSTLCSDCGNLEVTSLQSGQVLVGEARVESTLETCNGLLVVIDEILRPGRSVPGSSPPELECSSSDPSCCDAPPPEYSCMEQKIWGKCDEAWLVVGGYCKFTCGRCGTRPTFREPAREQPEEEIGRRGGDSGRGSRRQPRSPARYPCECTNDGYSGNVQTDRRGCFTINVAEEAAARYAGNAGGRVGEAIAGYWGGDAAQFSSYFAGLWSNVAQSWARTNMRDSTTNICYVVDPQNCASSRESELFPGARWRSCD